MRKPSGLALSSLAAMAIPMALPYRNCLLEIVGISILPSEGLRVPALPIFPRKIFVGFREIGDFAVFRLVQQFPARA
jgi:hypothetical protein